MKLPAVLNVAAELSNLARIRRFITEVAMMLDLGQDTMYALLQAVDESATNIIVHGYRNRPGPIEIEAREEDGFLMISLRDQARPFDPTALPPPDIDLPLEQRPIGGMGVYLTRQLMDKVLHRSLPQQGNELILMKKISGGGT
jgi:anti-sigma regulatory factor (Ser/Thr protein kinase)